MNESGKLESRNQKLNQSEAVDCCLHCSVFWDGSEFKGVPLLENLPDPKITFRKVAGGGGVKNHGGGTKPVRWLKSGELELATDSMMLSRADDHTYTGTVKFTVAFDAQHHATLKTVGKSKTTVD